MATESTLEPISDLAVEADVEISTPPANEIYSEPGDWNRLNWRGLIAQDIWVHEPLVLWDDIVKESLPDDYARQQLLKPSISINIV